MFKVWLYSALFIMSSVATIFIFNSELYKKANDFNRTIIGIILIICCLKAGIKLVEELVNKAGRFKI